MVTDEPSNEPFLDHRSFRREICYRLTKFLNKFFRLPVEDDEIFR